MDKIKNLLNLNIEIEGLLRTMLARPTAEAQNLLYAKFDEYAALFYDAISPAEIIEEESAIFEEPSPQAGYAEEIAPAQPVAIVEEEIAEPEPQTAIIEEEIAEPEPQTTIIEEEAAEPEPQPEIVEAEVSEQEENPIWVEIEDNEPEVKLEIKEIKADEAEPQIYEEKAELPAQEKKEEEKQPIIIQAPQQFPEPDTPLAETLVDNAPRIDQMISRNEAKDLSKAFTINDKFRFIRELFKNNRQLFNESLAAVSKMRRFDEAFTYFVEIQGFDPEEPNAKDFLEIIANHF